MYGKEPAVYRRLLLISHPCNRVSEKVYLFSVANGWAIGA